MPVSLELDVSYAARRPWVPRPAQFRRWAAAALGGAATEKSCVARGIISTPTRASSAQSRSGRRLAQRICVLSVRVVGATQSRSLNAHYRHKDKPTNVLSFAGAGLSPKGHNYLGELVICAPVVAREARSQGKAAQSHWAHLTVHGVLHLLGFDHERPAEARKMASKETQILDRLGISDPYA